MYTLLYHKYPVQFLKISAKHRKGWKEKRNPALRRGFGVTKDQDQRSLRMAALFFWYSSSVISFLAFSSLRVVRRSSTDFFGW